MEQLSLLNDNKNQLTTWKGTADVNILAILLMLRRLLAALSNYPQLIHSLLL